MLGKTVFVNGPSYAAWGYNTLLKPFLSQRTAEKTVFCNGFGSQSNSVASSCPFLMASIPLSDLPTFLGGSCACRPNKTDAVGGCCISDIPNTRSTLTISDEDGFATTSVGARTSKTVEWDMCKGATVEYAVKPVKPGQRFGVSVYFSAHDGGSGGGSEKRVQLMKSDRVDAQRKGISYKAESDGKLVFVFDNSQSWISSVAVAYRVEFVVADAVVAKTTEE